MTPRPGLLALLLLAPVWAPAQPMYVRDAQGRGVRVVKKSENASLVSPEDCPCPQNAAEAAQLLKDVLGRYGLSSPPYLGSSITLSSEGVYTVKPGPDGGVLFATKGLLVKEIEERLLFALSRGANEDSQRWVDAELSARFPDQAEELGALSVQGKAALLQFIRHSPIPDELKTIPKGLAVRLNAAASGQTITVLSEMFDMTGPAKARAADVYDSLYGALSLIHGSASRRDRADDPADRFAIAVERGEVKAKEFKPQARTLKTPAPPSVIFSRLRISDSNELGELLGDLKKRPDAEIAALRRDLLQLVSFEDEKIRSQAVYLLGRLHDPSLAPVFQKALNDGSRAVRDSAARGLHSVLGVIGLEEGFNGLVHKAPAVLSLLASGKDQGPFDETGKAVRRVMGFLNLMDEGQKKDFIAGFNDPAALAVILSLTLGVDVNESEGTHTPEGKALFQRLKELALARGQPLSLLLKDPAISREARERFFARANRYEVLKDMVKADPQLVAVAVETFFSSYYGSLRAEVFSAFKTMNEALGEKFYGIFLTAQESMGKREQAQALLFLKANEADLTPRLKQKLQAALARVIPDDFWEKVPAEDTRAPYYRAWPKGTLTAYLAMTQPAWADEFKKALRAAGYGLQGGFWIKKTAKRQVRLLLESFESSEGGWALDRDKLTSSLVGAYVGERFQVVVYRGHIGDYYHKQIEEASSKNKVFIDLGCDSDYGSYGMEKCENCEFFGTLTKAEGTINNKFLLEVLESLALGETHGQTRKRLAKGLPHTYHKFSGSWSPATRYEQYVRALIGITLR